MHPRLPLFFKLTIASALLTAIAGFGAHQLFLRVPLDRLVLVSLGGWVAVMATLALVVLGRAYVGAGRQRRAQLRRRWSD